MTAGRPRTTSFPPEEMEKLGQEMVEWVQNNKPLHLSEWYTIHKGFIYNEWKKFIEKEEFRPYYEQALKIIGKKYLDGTVNPSIAHRWLRVYFKDVKEEEDEEFKSKLDTEYQEKRKLLVEEQKLKAESTIDTAALESFSAIMEQLESLQKLRKSAKSNS